MKAGTRWECFPLLSKKEGEVRRRKAQHYRSVNINISKEVTCFSVFPMPGHFPNYIHNSQLLEYLRLYAKHLELVKYICFQISKLSSEHSWQAFQSHRFWKNTGQIQCERLHGNSQHFEDGSTV
nr:flavin-containing monooxygenase 5-like [Globicephala melas]